MENWPTLMGVAALAVLCDRMLAWMERRGWIYWRQGTEALRALPGGPAPAPPLPAEWMPPRDPQRMLRPPRRPLRRLGGRMRPRG